MTQWEWDLFVTVTRADGEVRKIPYGSWNDDLATKLKFSGATFELPKLPEVTPPPDYGYEGAVAPKKARSEKYSTDDLNDEELLECLVDGNEDMSAKDANNYELIVIYYRKFGYLNDRNRRVAEKLAKRYGLV